MSSKNAMDRLLAFVDEAVRAGRFESRTDFLRKAGLSTGTVGEFRKRQAENPDATMSLSTAQACARLLGISVADLMGERDDRPDVLDKYDGRAWAIQAARNLKLPEAAIQTILSEDPGTDPGAMYWFRRIESEALRVRPEQGSSQPDAPVPGPGAARRPSRPSPKR